MAERLLSKMHAIAQLLHGTGACEDHHIYDDVEFSWLQQMAKVLSKLKELSDWLSGDKHVTWSMVVHAIRKLEKFLLWSPDNTIYVTSFKRAFSSQLDHSVSMAHTMFVHLYVYIRFSFIIVHKCIHSYTVWVHRVFVLYLLDNSNFKQAMQRNAMERWSSHMWRRV